MSVRQDVSSAKARADLLPHHAGILKASVRICVAWIAARKRRLPVGLVEAHEAVALVAARHDAVAGVVSWVLLDCRVEAVEQNPSERAALLEVFDLL